MDFTGLIDILEKQLKLYSSLYQIALQKTDIVKKGDIPALNQLMKNEQKHVTTITILENQRTTLLKKQFPEQTEDIPTISDCIEQADSGQKTKLNNLFQELMATLDKLKSQNSLNQDLINHSLQFVNFSLNLFRPKLNNYNYGPNQGKPKDRNTASIFNSRV